MKKEYIYFVEKEKTVNLDDGLSYDDRFLIKIGALCFFLFFCLVFTFSQPSAGTIFCRDSGLGSYTYAGNDTGYCLNITAPVAFTPIQLMNGSWMLQVYDGAGANLTDLSNESAVVRGE